jgi:Planctomycete cytochrome C
MNKPLMTRDCFKLLVSAAVGGIVVTFGALPHRLVRADKAMQSADSAKTEFFEAKVRPLIATRCYDCHTDSSKGGLRVDSREAMLKGGRRGPAIVIGKPEERLLIKAVAHTHETLRMPKGAPKLNDQEIGDYGFCGWLCSILRLGASKRYATVDFVEKIFAPGVERK